MILKKDIEEIKDSISSLVGLLRKSNARKRRYAILSGTNDSMPHMFYHLGIALASLGNADLELHHWPSVLVDGTYRVSQIDS